ncbi:MarC family protein [Oceanicoccus sagamiensis]|uniref:UPF0056 membrane protein n=1 Tax=Oceanicoccus sagamiensis TaxID=716816 RepID=A0A1X9NJ47_9GAMM|nr:MarC family protein [Oceanicoccus sagamiensis]ARN75509.1 MarC family transcriptional regulator [Oceanicoccus sagamiensis]
MENFLAAFIFFFAVIDPIGTVPVFIAVTRSFEESIKRKIALKATLFSAIILLFFVVAGEFILTAIGISLSAFQIAGGIVLFLFALTMIFGESKPEEECAMVETSSTDTAIFPLAIPSIASPGAMLAAVLLTENSKYNFLEQSITVAAMLSVLVVVLVFLFAGSAIHRLIGDSGASLISRVMGLILASIAVSSVLEGVKTYFAL